MKQLATIAWILLALGGTLLAAPQVIRSYEWNGKRYCVIQRDDGSRIEIKGERGMKDAEAVGKCPVAEPMKAAEINPLAVYSDDEILAEVQRRGLLVEGSGTMGLKKGQTK